jgi:hypothetical protein
MKKLASGLFLLCSVLLVFGFSFSQGVITGLIIDAKDLSFIPSSSPKILDEDGREIYGSAYISKEWVEKQGMVGYAKSIEEAKANTRVSGNPYIVKAIKATGPNSKDLILSNAEAQRIRDLAKNLNFLDRAKVMIVVP